MNNENELISPKRSSESRERIFNYYAGYSSDFVRSVLSNSSYSKGMVVCDPWNGAGTTTQVCSEMGFKCFGGDINPVALILTKAGLLNNLLSSEELADLFKLLKNIEKKFYFEEDALVRFFQDGTASFLRGVERKIFSFFEGNSYDQRIDVEKIKPAHALVISCLFKVVKKYCDSLRGSNPTWIKVPKLHERVKILKRKTFLQELYEEIQKAQFVRKVSIISEPKLILKSSVNTGIDSEGVDLILSSPPYLTRIDYIVSTYIELAILNFPLEAVKSLRDSSIGTPTMTKQEIYNLELGNYGKYLLKSIREHASVASSGYYDKFFLQYMEGIKSSARELNRITRPNGIGIFVVQDSYYKNIKIDLGKLFIEIFESEGWKFESIRSFDVKQNMVYINSRSTSYRDESTVFEHVVSFKK